MLHLVGQTIDKTRSHYQAQTGALIHLVRGIYVDAGDDVESMVLQHAVRIAVYLYPRAYLSAASAILLAPTRDGRLFLSGRRIQRTRIRGLEIIQNLAPDKPSTGSAVVDDGMGEFRVAVSSVRQRLLEAFRIRSEHAASIDASMRQALAERLIEEYGSAESAVDAVWALARENGWDREGASAERFLLRPPVLELVRNAAALEFIVAWHGAPIGTLAHDGFEWRWTPIDGQGPVLIRQATPGQLPPFIVSLLPEGWLEAVLQDRDARSMLRTGERYLSNITIVERQSELVALPADILVRRLDQTSADGVFTGIYAGPGRADVEDSFERNLARIYERADTPRLSGIQIKAPMYLDADGRLSPSTGTPFTHILKPAGTGGFDALPIVEWMALELGRAIGLAVPATALINMPDGLPPALLVERFDIRVGVADTRMLALEDLSAVLGLSADAKYDGTMERVARAVRPLSTAPDADLQVILTRALFAWLIADGDMHLKNLALLKIAEPGAQQFRDVRMAPLYDAVTTRVFPRLQHDRMALKLNGKDENLHPKDFRAFARTAGVSAGDADRVIDETVGRLSGAVERVALPKLANRNPDSDGIVEQIRQIVRARIAALG